jgi:hypothetical protein
MGAAAFPYLEYQITSSPQFFDSNNVLSNNSTISSYLKFECANKAFTFNLKNQLMLHAGVRSIENMAQLAHRQQIIEYCAINH